MSCNSINSIGEYVSNKELKTASVDQCHIEQDGKSKSWRGKEHEVSLRILYIGIQIGNYCNPN